MTDFSKTISAILAAGVFAAATVSGPKPARAGDVGNILRGVGTIIILNERAKQQQQRQQRQGTTRQQATPSNPAARAEPRMSRATRQHVQAALNLLGYDAGVEDGVLGRGTRRAIGQYQRSIGAAATGYLTTDQLGSLRQTYQTALANGNPNLSKPLSKAEMKSFQRALKQMGYYRSTIDGVAGRGTANAIAAYLRDRGYNPDTVSTWDAYQIADAEAAGRPVPQPGGQQFAGMAGAGTSGAGQMGAGRPVFNLNNLGQEAGQLAGQGAGQGAGQAGFAAGTGQGGQGAPFERAAYINRGQKFDLNYELFRRLIGQNAAVLDDQRTLDSWIKELYRGRKFDHLPLTRSLYEAFSKGGSFQKNDARAAMKREIMALATTEPLRFTLTNGTRMNMAGFDPAKGVPLQFFDGNKPVESRAMARQRVYVRAVAPFDFVFDTMPDISWIKMDEPTARRVENALVNEGRRLVVRRYVTMTKASDYKASGTFSFENATVPEARLDRVEVVMLAPKRTGGPQEVLASFAPVDPNAAVATGSYSLEQLARLFGLKMRDGHLLIRDYDKYQSAMNRKSGEVWAPFFTLQHLLAQPALMEDDKWLLYAMGRVLTEPEKRMLARGRNLFGGQARQVFNEFEYAQIMDDIRTNHAAKISRIDAPYPLKVLDIRFAELGTYDFQNQSFPITWPAGAPYGAFEAKARRASENGPVMGAHKVARPWVNLPGKLDVPLDRAEAFSNYLDGRPERLGRTLIYAEFAEVERPVLNDDGTMTIPVRPTRAAFFADKALQNEVLDLPLDSGEKTDKVFGDHPAPFNEETIMLMLAKRQPELLGNEFAMDLVLKRQKRMWDSERKVSSALNRFVPQTIALARPGPSDRAKIAELLGAALADHGFDRMTFDVVFSAADRLEGMLAFSLKDSMQRVGLGRETDDYAGVLDAVSPNRVYERAMEGWRNVRLVLALEDDTIWHRVAIPAEGVLVDENGYVSAQVEVALERTKVVGQGNGQAIVTVFRPVALHVPMQGGAWRRIVLEKTALPKDPETERLEQVFAERELEMLGVKLGMSEAEARAAVMATDAAMGQLLGATEGGYQKQGGMALSPCDVMWNRMQRDLQSHRQTLAGQGVAGEALEAAVAAKQAQYGMTAPKECSAELQPYSRFFRAKQDHGNGIVDQVVFYLGVDGAQKDKVVMVTRVLEYPDGLLDIPTMMQAKLGADFYDGYGSALFWMDDLSLFRRAKADRDFAKQCLPLSPFPVQPNGGVTLRGIIECGSYLGVEAGGSGASFVLMDSRYPLEMQRIRKDTLEREKEEKKKEAVPKIKL